jgi:hypothetical protein
MTQNEKRERKRLEKRSVIEFFSSIKNFLSFFFKNNQNSDKKRLTSSKIFYSLYKI